MKQQENQDVQHLVGGINIPDARKQPMTNNQNWRKPRKSENKRFNIGDKVIIDNERYGKQSVRFGLVGMVGEVVAFRDIKQIPLCEEEQRTKDIAMYRVFTPHTSKKLMRIS